MRFDDEASNMGDENEVMLQNHTTSQSMTRVSTSADALPALDEGEVHYALLDGIVLPRP